MVEVGCIGVEELLVQRMVRMVPKVVLVVPMVLPFVVVVEEVVVTEK